MKTVENVAALESLCQTLAQVGKVALWAPDGLDSLELCDGQQVYECTTSEQMLNLLRSGKAVFGVSVGSLWHEIDEALEHEDYVDLASKPAALSSGRPIDELTAMRMRKKLEVQRAARQAA